MRNILYIIIGIVLMGLIACEKCEEIIPLSCNDTNKMPNSEYCGWTVATCYGRNTDPVAVLYNTSENHNVLPGTDWGQSIEAIHPLNWTRDKIGLVYGIAMDLDNNVFLAASDIYTFDNGWPNKDIPSGNANAPFPRGQIFKSSPPTYEAMPFVSLQNNGDPLNGIGNIAYDKWNNQLFASNLEDGKIYRIDNQGNEIESYDPAAQDNGTLGLAPTIERVWAIGVNYEDGLVKVYFPLITKSSRILYSITLVNGAFPSSGEEVVEIPDVYGDGPLISDLAFSSDGQKLLISERGNPHAAELFSYNLNNGWEFNTDYFIGTSSGNHCAGGVDFAYESNAETSSFICDERFWASGNIMDAGSQDKLYGITNISFYGNEMSEATSNQGNNVTDLFIDFDGVYNFSPKEEIGDVEVFDCTDCGGICDLNSIIN